MSSTFSLHPEWESVHESLQTVTAGSSSRGRAQEEPDQQRSLVCGDPARSLHALFVSIGARGHFNPMLQLARALLRRPGEGWKVTWATGSFGNEWLKHDVGMDVVSGGLDSIVTLPEEVRAHLTPFRSHPDFDSWWMAYAVTHVSVPVLYNTLRGMTCKPDVMVIDSSTFSGLLVAEMLHIPYVINSPFLLCGVGVPTGTQFCAWDHLVRSSVPPHHPVTAAGGGGDGDGASNVLSRVAALTTQPAWWYSTWRISYVVKQNLEAAIYHLLDDAFRTGQADDFTSRLQLAATTLSLRLPSRPVGVLSGLSWSSWRLYAHCRLFLQNSVPGMDAIASQLPRQMRFIGSTDYNAEDEEEHQSTATVSRFKRYLRHASQAEPVLYEFFVGRFPALAVDAAVAEADVRRQVGAEACTLVSMGTLIHPNRDVLERIVLALRHLRCVVWPMASSMRSLLPKDTPPSFLFPVFINLPLLLQSGLVAVFVSHCGMGSTQQSLLASVPLLCLPHATDQPDVSHRITSLGAGLLFDPHRHAEWSADGLHAAHARLLHTGGFRESAKAIGALLRTAGGAARGALMIQQVAVGLPVSASVLKANGTGQAGWGSVLFLLGFVLLLLLVLIKSLAHCGFSVSLCSWGRLRPPTKPKAP